MEGIGIPIVSGFGLIGNMLSIHVLRSQSRQLDLNSNFVMLLICLAVFDSLFLIFANLVYSIAAILQPSQSKLQIWSIPYILPLTHMSLTGSVYSVVAVTVERYTTLKGINYKTVWKGRALIIFIVTFSILYNVIKFFELQVEVQTLEPTGEDLSLIKNSSVINTTTYVINATPMRRHPVYSFCYIVVGNFLFMNLLPFSTIALMNFFIFKILKSHTALHNTVSSSHRRDTTMVALLFSIVIIFLICNSPRLCLNIYEAIQMFKYGEVKIWPNWATQLTYLNHLLFVINSSSNIIIYVAKDFKFRAALLECLGCQSQPVDTVVIRHRRSQRQSRGSTMCQSPDLTDDTLL